MLAGLVLLSTTVGIAAIAAAIALSAPTWVVLAVYPATGSLTLLCMAALWNIRTAQPAQNAQLLRTQG